MEFRILGPLEVIHDGRHIALGAPKQRALLAVLLIHAGEVVPIDELLGALWGEAPPRTSITALHGHVSSLRKAFDAAGGGNGGRDRLITVGFGYSLDVRPEHVDAGRFEHLASQGAHALHEGRPAEASEKLRSSLALWRGRALADFTYDSFAEEETRRLEELRLTALEDRIESELALGRHAQLVGELHTLIARWPLRERMRQHLMLALYRSGRQAEALEVFRSGREAFAEKIGIDPGPPLRRLEKAILDQDRSLDLPARAVTSAEVAGSPRRMRSGSERKLITVLFCEVVPFGSASDPPDPEDVRSGENFCRTLVSREIERFGGNVAKRLGTAVTVVFGAPLAREDDAERAVRCGLRILEHIQELRELDPVPRLYGRIGIATGEALIDLGADPGSGRGLLSDEVPDAAARIQRIAPVDGIVVAERTYRLTRDEINYEEWNVTALEDASTPAPTWRVLSARGRVGMELAKVTTPFIGRGRERALLQATFDRSLADPSVQLVTIVGEPGIGKSRLMAELFTLADDRSELISWRQGRCPPYGDGIAFWALAEIVKAHCGILESDPAEEAASKLTRTIGSLASDDADRTWLIARLSPLLGLSADAAEDFVREEAFTAWRTFLERIAEREPLVVVIEDAHWADPALLAFLTHVIERSFNLPLTVVVTARPELYDREPNWAGGLRNAITISLAPLTVDETGELIAALLHEPLPAVEIRSVLVERSGGNPLFAEQFVSLLTDNGMLARDGRVWRLVDGNSLPIPESIQAIVEARLDAVPADHKALLMDAAVIGDVFWSSAVAAMSERFEADVERAFRDLARRELVRPVRSSSMAGSAEYAFWHGLVADVAYQEIPAVERCVKHLSAAAWIEEAAGKRLEDRALILAHHYSTAFDLAVADGREDLAQRARPNAFHYLILAGDHVLHLDARTAETLYRKALDLAPRGDERRSEALLRWADALRQTGEYTRAKPAFEEAIALFGEAGDSLSVGRSMTLLAHVEWVLGGATRDLVGNAVRVLESQPPSRELVEAYTEKARHEFLDSDYQQAIITARLSIDLAARLGLEEPARALGYLGDSRAGAGDVGGIADMQKALELCNERGQVHAAITLHNNLASWLLGTEGPRAAADRWLEGMEFARSRGAAAEFLAAARCAALFQLGLWDQLIATVADLEDELEATGSVMSLRILRESQARVLAYQGHGDEAIRLAKWMVQVLRETGTPQHALAALSTDAMARLQAGARTAALTLLSEVEHSIRVVDHNLEELLPELIRTSASAGDLSQAERLIRLGEPVNRHQEHAMCAARAILSEARGKTESAMQLYSEAIQGWQGMGVVPETAFALLGLGRCQISVGIGDAIATLTQARSIFRFLRAAPALDETNALLERATTIGS